MKSLGVVLSAAAAIGLLLEKVHAADRVVGVDFISFSDTAGHSGADGVLSTSGTYWNALYPYNVFYSNQRDENGETTPIGIGFRNLASTFTNTLPNTLQRSGYVGYFQCWFAPLASNAIYDLVIYVSRSNTAALVVSGAGTNAATSSASGPTGLLPGVAGRDYLLFSDLTKNDYDRITVYITAPSPGYSLVGGMQLRERSIANAAPPELLTPELRAGGAAVLRWSSVSNHNYTLYYSTNLQSGFSVVPGSFPATPPLNIYTDSVSGVMTKFWKVSTEP